MAESLYPNRQKSLINMNWNIRFLKALGVVGMNDSNTWEKILYCVYCTAIVAMHVIIGTAAIAAMVRGWGDFDTVINTTVIIMAMCSLLLRYSFLLFKHQDMCLLLRMLWEFENFQWPQSFQSEWSHTVTKTNRHIRNMIVALGIFFLFIFLAWAFCPIISIMLSGDGPTKWRPHPFSPAYFFDSQPSPNYEIIYGFQAVSMFTFSFIGNSFDSLCVAFFMQAAGQFRVLIASLIKLQDLVRESAEYGTTYNNMEIGNTTLSIAHDTTDGQQAANSDMHQYLRTCVNHHNNVIRGVHYEFVRKLDDVLNPIMLAQILYSMLEIAVSGLQASESLTDFGNMIKLAVYTTSLSFEVYFFCKHADSVLQLSQEVATTAYSCEWYNMDREMKTMLQIIIMRAQRPVQLTAFRFRVLSVDLYGSLLNAAYSYFALLKQMK